MASTIIIKNGTAEAPADLIKGELAINTKDGFFYFGDGSTVQQLHRFTHISASGNITASGDISASGNIYGTRVQVANSLLPDANDGASIGSTGLQFSDLFLAEGGVINFDNGDVTITQTGNDLAIAGTENTSFVGHITASGNISSSGNIIATNDITGSSAKFTDTKGIYTDKIRRNSDSDNTTKILLNDEVIKFNAGHSSDETLRLEQNVASIAGHITASGNISSSGDIMASAGANGTQGFTVRPNLYWFATNSGETVAANNNDGAFPSTDTDKIEWTEDFCSHQDVFVFASDTLTITRAGLYKFTYNVTLGINNGSNRTEGGIAILRTPDGGSIAVVDGSVTSTYNRFVEGGGLASRATGAATILINVAADDVFQINFAKICDTSDATKLKTLPEGTSWYVEAVT
jgi:Ni,Fe-hydrogenase I small subunit